MSEDIDNLTNKKMESLNIKKNKNLNGKIKKIIKSQKIREIIIRKQRRRIK